MVDYPENHGFLLLKVGDLGESQKKDLVFCCIRDTGTGIFHERPAARVEMQLISKITARALYR
jgi:hypothetical protein